MRVPFFWTRVSGLGSRVQGLWFVVCGVGFVVCGLGFGVWDLGFVGWGFDSKVSGLDSRASGLEARIAGNTSGHVSPLLWFSVPSPRHVPRPRHGFQFPGRGMEGSTSSSFSGLGCRVSVFRLRVLGFGFRVSGFKLQVQGLGSRVGHVWGWKYETYLGLLRGSLESAVLCRPPPVDTLSPAGIGFRVDGFGFRFSVFGFRVSCFVFRVSCFRFRVSGFRFGIKIRPRCQVRNKNLGLGVRNKI